MYVCMYQFMYVCMHVRTTIYMYVCMYIPMYVCMYVCMYADPLSAVDAHVGQHLFDECVMSLKGQGKCVILVTNALKHVKHATYIVVLKDGKVIIYVCRCMYVCMYVYV